MDAKIIDETFWRKKRVLLTGHTGFKGAWLTLWLTRMGAKVTGYALAPPSTPSLFEIAAVSELLAADLRADILDFDRLHGAVRDHRPEIVIHMAAQSLVRPGYSAPVDTYATNVMGTAHVLEAARHASGLQAVLIVTSDKCYENFESTHPYSEHDRLGGRDPYSASKACAELVTAAYRASYFDSGRGAAKVASARAGNVIGGGDWATDRLVPDCIHAFMAGEPVVLRYPEAVRPWQHVLDPLAGYLSLCQKLYGHQGQRFAGGWNFGPDPAGEGTVLDVAQGLARHWGQGARVERATDRATLQEAGQLRLDSTKASALLGWRPRWDFQRALAETASWYRGFSDGADMRGYCEQQIDAFRDAAS